MLSTTQLLQVHQIDADTLFSTIELIIDKKLSGFLPNTIQAIPIQTESFINQEEARKFLGNISDVTMWKYRKKGLLKAHRLGKMLRYKVSELTEALAKINPTK